MVCSYGASKLMTEIRELDCVKIHQAGIVPIQPKFNRVKSKYTTLFTRHGVLWTATHKYHQEIRIPRRNS